MKKRNKAVFVLWQGIALVAILVSLLAVGFGASIAYAGGGGAGGGSGAAGGSGGATGGSGGASGGGNGGAVGAGNCYTAEISPILVPAGSTNTFALIVTNVSDWWEWWEVIGRVEVDVPVEFTGITNVDAWASHWWTPATDQWSSGFIAPTIWAQADTWAECLFAGGDYVVITFDATAPSPPATTTYPFYTTAYNSYPVWVPVWVPMGCWGYWSGYWGVGISCPDEQVGPDPEVTVEVIPEEPEVLTEVLTPTLPLLRPEAAPVSTPVLVVDMLGTIVRYPVTNSGILLVDAMTTSPDGLVTLFMPAGTQVLNSNGTPAYLNKDPDLFSIAAATPAAPAGYTMVAAYEFLPSGIIFSPDATVIMKYDAAKMAAGVPVIAYYDEAAGQWINLETAGYVAGGVEVPNTVQAHTAHLTYFAILAK